MSYLYLLLSIISYRIYFLAFCICDHFKNLIYITFLSQLHCTEGTRSGDCKRAERVRVP